MSVRDIDRGWKKIKAEMSEFAKHDVIVGWIEGKKSERNEEGDQAAGINNATLAAIHEFPNEGTVSRLGFREWQDRSMNEIGDHIEDAYRNSIKRGGDAMRELNKLGLWAVSAWRKYQREVQPGPDISKERLAEIGRKHGQKAADSHRKLVDTGQLVQGATHVVRRRVG